MGPKVQQDKLAWQWAETTDPDGISDEHRESAYRIKLKPCSRVSGHRNCKGNPHCLVGLGEKVWFEEIDESSWHDLDDPEKERRQKGAFVGLKNLGATCYVNTFLQLWFHNLKFRDAIYKWRSLEDICRDISDQAVSLKSSKTPGSPKKKSNNGQEKAEPEEIQQQHTKGYSSDASCSTMTPNVEKCRTLNGDMLNDAEEKKLQPDTICGHLQLIFALLQFSNRRYIDPKPFIDCMGLDAAYQQDAQEFSKLFMSLLEGQLAQQGNPTVKNLVQELFKGEYNYVTQCSKCSNNSLRSSEFYELELNIKGHSEIHQCLGEFLEDEKLDGDNQYFCSHCQSKQNATRRIKLKKIPDVLNLQLLRFVFDRKTGQKKKLNTFIEFPELIDLSTYLDEEAGKCMYDLKAVLIHRGPSAYSGHYIAHIKDSDSQNWHKFNDVTIEKIGGRNLQLGNEEDVESKGVKKPRTAKGLHTSRNAYMLVYQRKSDTVEEIKEATFSSLPERTQKLVTLDQQKFENWVLDMKAMKDKNVECGLARQQGIKDIFGMMSVGKDVDWEWIKTSWLKSWLDEIVDAKVPEIDHTSVVCPHEKLNPSYVTEMKCVTEGAAEILYTKYCGGPRLKGPESICSDCVRERCRVIRMKSRLAEDHKTISTLLKQKDPIEALNIEECFWAGKESLRGWRKMALKQIENAEKQINTMGTEEKETLNISQAKQPDIKAESSNGLISDVHTPLRASASNSSAEEEDTVFNEDILCDHRKLNTNESSRRLVSADLWRRFKVYFPNSAEFQFGSEMCKQCKLKDEEEEQTLQLNKQMATEQKSALQHLYLDKNRPLWKKDVTELNIITKNFLEEWRTFLKDPTRNEAVQGVNNNMLLCRHGKFPFEPNGIGTSDSTEHMTYIWPHEWNILGKFMSLDTEVRIMKIEEESGHVTYISAPDACKECFQEKKEADHKALSDFKSAVVYVRKMSDKDIQIINSQFSSSQLSLGSSEEYLEKDPDFMQKTTGKRKNVEQSPQVEKAAKLDTGSRRSSRHRKVRGEKEIEVSSTQKLLDLKIEIMKHFSAAPMDQHIWVNGEELKGNDKLLGELGVTPGAILMLKIDEAGEEALFLEDVARAAQPEKGFQGTGLMRA